MDNDNGGTQEMKKGSASTDVMAIRCWSQGVGACRTIRKAPRTQASHSQVIDSDVNSILNLRSDP